MMKKVIAIVLFFFSFLAAHSQVTLRNLRCEMLTDPLSVTETHPRLSWELESKQRGILQQAYEILVASTPEKLAAGEGDIWSSGKVNSDASLFVSYQGKALKSRTTCYWKVKVWTNKGESPWSNTAFWGTGLKYYKDWEGRWIGFDRTFAGDSITASRLAARYFRKELEVTKQVKSATAYIMGLGLFELTIDGKKVGDQVLAPVATDYTQNIKYNTLDVTAQLQKGKHAIGVTLGNGRFFAMRQTKAYKNKSFGFPKLLMNVFITYTDGSQTVVKTDDSWTGVANGPILANNEYDGEEYDARKELAGWDRPGFNDKAWLKAEFVQEPGGVYEPQMNEGIKVMRDMAPVTITRRGGNKYIIDFGQNFSGWVKLRAKGNSGQRIELRFAESLQPDGELFTTNLRDAKATDIYIMKGGSAEIWEPRFTYHGFRYAEVSGYPGTLSKQDITGRLVYDDIATTGSFESSDTMLNRIYRNAWWTIASGYKGIPIDCPQRNERQPWLADRAMTAYGENFLFDNARIYTKWLDDIMYAQKADGAIPDVAPAFWRYYSDNMTWPGTYLMIAEMLYNQTGDITVLQKHYPAMKKWLAYMKDRYMTEDGIVTKDSYGDWCEPPATAEAGRGVNADQKHPSQLIATAYYYHFMEMMIRFGVLTGNAQDSAGFAQTAEKVKAGFNKKFYHEAGYYGNNSLTDNLLPVCFKMIEPANKSKVWKNLAYIVEETNKNHLSTGLIGVQWLMYGLTEIGKAEVAYAVAQQKTYPSWGYMIENGATTIWELWNGNTAAPKMNSQNHVMMLGDLLVWYFEHLAAIRSDAKQVGFKKIIMKPKRVGTLEAVNASYRSSYGIIKSDWKGEGKNFKWNITIPANTTATVYMPANDGAKVYEGGRVITGKEEGISITKVIKGRVVLELGSGDYAFEVRY